MTNNENCFAWPDTKTSSALNRNNIQTAVTNMTKQCVNIHPQR